jgi:hypothetical protein
MLQSSASFKFECPSCGQRISATVEDAGTVGICPACRNEFEVPGAQRVPDLPVAAAAGSEKRGSFGLAMVALALCLMPGVCWMLLSSIAAEVSPTKLGMLAGVVAAVAAVLGVAGVIAGHRAWRRAVGQIGARAISVLSLVVGYFSILALALGVAAVVTGTIVLYKHYEEPPDFAAGDEILFTPVPSPTPTPKSPAGR